jgi:hypothetical protein
MDIATAIASGAVSVRSGLFPVSRAAVNAMYSQMLADGQFFVPLISGAIPIEEWRDRELARAID